MDKRFYKIRELLTSYSLGNFDRKLSISSRMDEIDAFIAGINMLGEELKEKTISRDYFNNIFNSVSDMVFVINKLGVIEKVNQSVCNHLGYDRQFLTGKSIGTLFDKHEPGWINNVQKQIRNAEQGSFETSFIAKNKESIPVLITATKMLGERRDSNKLIITAKNISEQKETQNKILKAIIETEENERTRFAQDIHDSIGQQLSAIKFYIGASADRVEDPGQKTILLKANAALIDVQADMRNICFNIMPKSLEVFGLTKTVEELISKNPLLRGMNVVVDIPPRFPRLPIKQEYALFRIIQEFINNSLKHSQADGMQIEFVATKTMVFINLKDNGIGFDLKDLAKKGMGLNHVRSRLKPYHGNVEINSRPGKGTSFSITIPRY